MCLDSEEVFAIGVNNDDDDDDDDNDNDDNDDNDDGDAAVYVKNDGPSEGGTSKSLEV